MGWRGAREAEVHDTRRAHPSCRPDSRAAHAAGAWWYVLPLPLSLPASATASACHCLSPLSLFRELRGSTMLGYR